MPLIDDIEFYGRAVDAGEMPRDQAARLLAEASNGGITELGAYSCIDKWATTRSRLESIAADTVDMLRAIDNGRPIPEHVTRNMRKRTFG